MCAHQVSPHRLTLLLMALLLLPVSGWATTDTYPFSDPQDADRFRTLISELRCPKCQNQNIADSNAPIAKDMRDEVYRMLQQGASNEEVTESLVGRFGEFVRYKPELDRRTALLWATPVIAVLGGLLVVIGIVIRSRRRPERTAALSDEERRQAEALLKDSGNDR